MASGIDWFRWHHGSVTDQKFQLIARKAQASVAEVIAVWATLLEAASMADDRGLAGDPDCEAIDCALGITDGTTARIITAMADRGLLTEDGYITSWEKRQPKRERENDNSTERSRAFRERQRHATPCNATEHTETPREEKSREESTSSLRSDVVAPHAADEPQRKTSGTPKRATQLPNDFEPDETASRVAAELGVSVSRELPKFRDYHAAKGKPMKDWQAAFRTWLRNAKEYARPAAKQTDRQRQIEWLADLTGRTADAIDAPARLVG